MGYIRNYKCKCGYKKRVLLGMGLSGVNLESIQRSVPQEVYEAFDEYLKSGQIEQYSFLLENVLTVCEKCKEFYVAPYLHYVKIDGSKIGHIRECPDCGGDLKLLDEQDSKNPICPKCGEIMESQFAGMWD